MYMYAFVKPEKKQVFSLFISMVREEWKKKNANEIQNVREWPKYTLNLCIYICVCVYRNDAKNEIFNSWYKLNFYIEIYRKEIVDKMRDEKF